MQEKTIERAQLAWTWSKQQANIDTKVNNMNKDKDRWME